MSHVVHVHQYVQLDVFQKVTSIRSIRISALIVVLVQEFAQVVQLNNSNSLIKKKGRLPLFFYTYFTFQYLGRSQIAAASNTKATTQVTIIENDAILLIRSEMRDTHPTVVAYGS